MTDVEEWRAAPGFPLYEVSDRGRLRRNPRTPSHLPREALALFGGEYLAATLMQDGRPVKVDVHRIVCLAFHGEPPTSQHQAAHWSPDKHDNRPGNVRWATPKENVADKRRHGTHKEGEAIPWARLTEGDVRAIRVLLQNTSQGAIAASYGVSLGAINGIATGRSWKHVA